MNSVYPNLSIHHVALVSDDFDRSVAFYRRLGFEPYRSWGEGGGRAVMLDIGNGSYLEIFANGDGSDRSNGRWLHLAFAVDDVAAAYEKAIAAGAEPHVLPKTATPPNPAPVPITIRCAFVKGPDGEQLEFIHVD